MGYKMDQTKAPLYKALRRYRDKRIVPFDVPGHKQGRGNPEMTEFFGKAAMMLDVNSSKNLDNLIHPVGVIRDAQELAADAFGADSAFFMVNGTSSAVQAMVMTCVGEGEEIIMPRNVHRSAINALILTGAVPVYVDPGQNDDLGIPLGMALADVEKAVKAHPLAKAILVNNPTYYGVCADLEAIVELGHKAGMRVLVDEAHGTHFYFGEDLPPSAMSCGADMAAVSMHKTGGSLTQSSLLLLGKSMEGWDGYVRQIINLTQTTSASYLLMSSLDISRRNLALNGTEIYAKVVQMAQYAREEINAIGGYHAFSDDVCNGDSFKYFDHTKLSVHTRAMGLAGIEVYDILRDDYDIQIEFGDLGNFLAILSVGDRQANIERLIAALADIYRTRSGSPAGLLSSEYIEPEVAMSPKEAFFSPTIAVPIQSSLGYVSAEFVMCYPPGIPILAPGERVTQDQLDYIKYAKEKGSSMSGTEDITLQNLNVLAPGRPGRKKVI